MRTWALPCQALCTSFWRAVGQHHHPAIALLLPLVQRGIGATSTGLPLTGANAKPLGTPILFAGIATPKPGHA